MRERILIIDDETDFCGIMINYFLKRNYDARATSTIREGLELMREFLPGILLLDNNLPDGNGWEIVEEVVDLFPQIRIYLISAHQGISDYQGGRPNVLVWEKPISIQVLNSVFGSGLNRYSTNG